jgi:hypothetical protein
MHIEDLKRWHWATISVIVGFALSYLWSDLEWRDRLATIGQADFERGVMLTDGERGSIAKVTVMPPQDGKCDVFCHQMRHSNDGQSMELRPVTLVLDVPFIAQRSGRSYSTVQEYLQEVQRSPNPKLKLAYAWYRETWVVRVLCCGMSLLLIGGIWPSVLSVMTGRGLMANRGEEKVDLPYDLTRFKPDDASTSKSINHDTASQDDFDDVRKLDDQLETLLTRGSAKSAVSINPVQTLQTPVSALTGGPLELTDAQMLMDDKEYGGEFYPVARTVKKHEDDESQGHVIS